MKVGIISSLYNKSEQQFNQDLLKKIKVLGYQAGLVKDNLDYDILVIVFDGRALEPVDYVKLGLFIDDNQNKLIVGYLTANIDLGDIKKYLNRIAQTELGLINCLKEYIFSKKHAS